MREDWLHSEGDPVTSKGTDARSGPTSIYSRNVGARFQATAKIVYADGSGGGNVVGLFTEQPITNPEELQAVARLAGEEARRIDGRKGEPIRTWEQLKDMPEDERTAGMQSWPKLTENKVALYVR